MKIGGWSNDRVERVGNWVRRLFVQIGEIEWMAFGKSTYAWLLGGQLILFCNTTDFGDNIVACTLVGKV